MVQCQKLHQGASLPGWVKGTNHMVTLLRKDLVVTMVTFTRRPDGAWGAQAFGQTWCPR